ncbi:hypothetical protein [Jannaschia seohaensis]|uniref:Uncharacterized protein n=1 Tax=Jannaschia seohaensis TaxID=475081 RepID=A0A2Y9ANB7_9RHOB|nr:hypothetical protein [Jannaschia seohaensis]PWJ19362.1 hypothetical protein BCF38_104298 [Jannaschia seohaensis]SSA46024.1 hypothetical protein SAMN05421539_104298 [Jannaschia seohaensis]
MEKLARFWSAEDRPAEICEGADPLETLNAAVGFKMFRPNQEYTAGCKRSPKGGCLDMDVVPRSRMLILESLHGLTLKATGKMVRDRLS